MLTADLTSDLARFNVVFACFADRQPFLKPVLVFYTVGIWCYRLLLTSRSTHTSLSLALSLVFLFFAGTEDIFDTWFKRKRMVFLNKQCLKPQIAPAIITCMCRLRIKPYAPGTLITGWTGKHRNGPQQPVYLFHGVDRLRNLVPG